MSKLHETPREHTTISIWAETLRLLDRLCVDQDRPRQPYLHRLVTREAVSIGVLTASEAMDELGRLTGEVIDKLDQKGGE